MRLHASLLIVPALVLSAGGTHVHDGDGFTLVEGGHSSSFGACDGGFLAKADGPGLWFRHQGATYVVRDPKLLAEARAAIEPCERLGKEQGSLGAEQGRLGAKQGGLGAKQGALGARMPGANSEEANRLNAQMADLAKQQEFLGAEQEKLGHRQEELGLQQEAASDAAMEKLREIRDRALAAGLAIRQ
jgi:hypothetical protein